jgi:hypothetical protein
MYICYQYWDVVYKQHFFSKKKLRFKRMNEWVRPVAVWKIKHKAL